jgi:hypothetical protein
MALDPCSRNFWSKQRTSATPRSLIVWKLMQLTTTELPALGRQKKRLTLASADAWNGCETLYAAVDPRFRSCRRTPLGTLRTKVHKRHSTFDFGVWPKTPSFRE